MIWPVRSMAFRSEIIVDDTVNLDSRRLEDKVFQLWSTFSNEGIEKLEGDDLSIQAAIDLEWSQIRNVEDLTADAR